jgi:hypothetical protein
MTPATRRSSAERAAKRELFSDLDRTIEAREEALRELLFTIRASKPDYTIAGVNRLRGLLREADAEAETLVELLGRKKRRATPCPK